MAILCKYTYDPLDRVSTVTPLAQAVANRFYNGEHLMTELHGDRQRTCIRAGAQWLAQQSREGDEVVTTMIASDLHNSVLHASKDGHQADIAYTPFGHHQAGQTIAELPGFNGEQPDPLTGHYLLGNGYRAYNPVLMRFNSPDSMSPFGKGGLNAYAYCVGDPVNRVDPTGHESAWFWVSLALSLFSSAAGVRGMILSRGRTREMVGSAVAILTGVVALAPATASGFVKESDAGTRSILEYGGFGLSLSSALLGLGFLASGRMRQRRINNHVIAGRRAVSGAVRGSGPRSNLSPARSFDNAPPRDSSSNNDLPPTYDSLFPNLPDAHVAAGGTLGTPTASSINSTGSSDIPLQNVGSTAQTTSADIRTST
ncbi:RHS repeat-associated core domain-containing protein [Pseudomonas syringae]|uniref:RHS repeat-associated core domain-containing protein n=1 Tax=Pseudomonas syringae TaxID=317 RepID=UPI001F3E747D|nr:RHS repeat-associated core domain-containing protein [Pseudomonas syringae]MCF9001591.1 RHS repeat-associated core domain-containing protein [Pseudomonas syringae]